MAAPMNRYVCTVDYTYKAGFVGLRRGRYNTVIEAENTGIAIETARRQCQRLRKPSRIISAIARLETRS